MLLKYLKSLFKSNKIAVSQPDIADLMIAQNGAFIQHDANFTIFVKTPSYTVDVTGVLYSDELYNIFDNNLIRNQNSMFTSCLHKIPNVSFIIFIGNTPISRRHVHLFNYNIHCFATLRLEIYLNHGGNKDYIENYFEETNLYSYNVALEQQLLNNVDLFEVQTSDEHLEIEKMLKFITKNIQIIESVSQFSKHSEWIISTIENFVHTILWYKKCDTYADFIQLMCSSYKLFTGKSSVLFIKNKISKMFRNEVQSSDFGDMLIKCRQAFTTIDSVSENPMIKKIISLYTYLLVQGFLEKFGFKVDDENYSRMEQKALLLNFSSRKALVLNIIDTTLFICERIYEWQQTGDFSSFTHSEQEYVKWGKEADRILALSGFTSNLEVHGTSYFSYISDLNDCVEKGEAYVKFMSKTSGIESIAMKKKVYALQLLKNTEITKRASQKERRAPFGVLVHGTSSIAKSTFSKMLYYYYGSLFNLDKDDHFRYVRNPADEYWSNFDSSKWCIQMDDIAFLLPSKASDADPTLMEMLNVVNNVPYVPPQAALEDKGKTPVMARLVIATSNAADLNAQEYFWCPLAVRRRLPYVLKVEPKDEYLHENRRFIDPTKLKPITTEYPDYWKITVQKIVPVFNGQRDLAQLETVNEYLNINDFLRDFGMNCQKHEDIQDKAMNCDDLMKDISVCSLCYMNKTCCKCSYDVQTIDENVAWSIYKIKDICDFTKNTFFEFMMFIFQCNVMLGALLYFTKFKLVRKFVVGKIFNNFPAQKQIQVFGRMNHYISNNYNKNWFYVISFLSTLSVVVSLFIKFYKKKNISKSYAAQSEATRVAEQLGKEERQNVWYNPTLELTTFDIPKASTSLKTLSDDDVREKFGRNSVRLNVRTVVDGVRKIRTIGATRIKGHYFLTNNHAFNMDLENFEVEIIQMQTLQGLNSNINIYLHKNDIIRCVEKDICIFEVKSLPASKDISKFWSIKNEINVTKALVLRRLDNGTLEKLQVFGLNRTSNFPIESLGISRPMFLGQVPRETRAGDCGSIGVATTPQGPIIFGIHTLGYGSNCGIMGVTIGDIDSLIAIHKSKFSDSMDVQGDNSPMLDLEHKKSPLTEPHHRSLFRYLEEGTANIYGSFAGAKSQPKSRVSATPLQKEFLNYFNTTVQHDKPVMNGWNPWKNNIVEMVKPNVNYNRTILNECVQGFSENIISKLPKNWGQQLLFLGDEQALLGVPGVKFIDRINCSTSMGFPWGCSKAGFLKPKITEDYPDGVDFEQEVWDRVNTIKQNYSEGRRVFPIFTGHLKDEPTPFAKIAKEKTRVFTGAPVDWSLVVRSRLLPFVRLLQNNKFVFEAGPGTVCQSSEWGTIYNYLCVFGEDRIIAGDYGKFDKRMLSDFILAAFEIIRNIYAASNTNGNPMPFSYEQLREIMCIGEDTAFPCVNMNGDLVEFFGTNPSGHPLTVIINSLVNSLYMRYCYRLLNPKKEVISFQENVKLFTYGDDNIMGVHRACDWFNHTGIQSELKKIGVEYTMADKDSPSVPFINIQDCQFLKRKWRFDEDVGEWLCPLEEASIYKSLTVWIPSKTIDEYAQMVAVIQSANTEYFFYGKEVFERHHTHFKQILARDPYKYYCDENTIPNWDALVERFHNASK